MAARLHDAVLGVGPQRPHGHRRSNALAGPCTRRCSTTPLQARPRQHRPVHLPRPRRPGLLVDWDAAADATVALLRAEAGREPHDRALRELVGELSILSPEFRSQWAAHNVRIRHDGVKRLRHPEVGALELTYQSLDLPTSLQAVHDLTTYTAEPGTASEDRLKLLASWAAPSAGSPRASSQPTEGPIGTS